MDKETDWFPAHIKPVYEGVYKTRHVTKNGQLNQGYSMYRINPSKFGHTGWCWLEETPRLAAQHQNGSIRDKEWKGLTKL